MDDNWGSPILGIHVHAGFTQDLYGKPTNDPTKMNIHI